jgi:hypothetical protein
MSYSVDIIAIFDKQAKRLAKKHASLKSDLLLLIDSLNENPIQGTDLGNGFFKIRIAISSKNKGKSGGARVITFVKVTDEMVYLASIFDKSEKENISDKELQIIFNLIP